MLSRKVLIVEDPQVQGLIGKVVCLSGFLLLLAFIAFIYDLVQKQYAGVLNLVIPVAILCCGYFGAKQRNRNLLCCYCGWSMVIAVIMCIAAIACIAGYFLLKDFLGGYTDCTPTTNQNGAIECACCKPNDPTAVCVNYDCTASSSTSKFCPYPNPTTPQQCTDNINSLTSATGGLIGICVLSFILMTLYCCMYCSGKALYEHPFYAEIVQTSAQPGYIAMGAPTPVVGQPVQYTGQQQGTYAAPQY